MNWYVISTLSQWFKPCWLGSYNRRCHEGPVTPVKCEARKCIVWRIPNIDAISCSTTPTWPLVASILSQCKVLIVSTFTLLSPSTLYTRSCADVSTRYIP